VKNDNGRTCTSGFWALCHDNQATHDSQATLKNHNGKNCILYCVGKCKNVLLDTRTVTGEINGKEIS
jgi:hypothetical protein